MTPTHLIAPILLAAPLCPAAGDADSWWAVQPLTDPAPPAVATEGWARNDIDRFILAKLEPAGIAPAPEADREPLLRRAFFDLLGMPPSPEEFDAFMNDTADGAYERLIDRLLEDPRYGERWARHWLDVVRYAESDGFRQDAYRPRAWRYRDYVIDAFNDDKPYDRFVLEQLAGDEAFPGDPEALTATGFLRHGLYEYNQRDVRTQWEEILNDLTDTAGDVFLGVGMGCARCHDHKFDPVSQKDYFALRAFFAPIQWRDDLPVATPEQLADYREKRAAWEAATAEIRAELDAIEQPYLDKAARGTIIKFPDDIQAILNKPEAERDPLEKQLGAIAYRQVLWEWEDGKAFKSMKDEDKKRRDELRAKLAEFDKLKPQEFPESFGATDVGTQAPPMQLPSKTGDGEVVEVAFLSALGGETPAAEAGAGTTGRRTALAQWITDPGRNPLGARVMANRIWGYHFGRGIVPTPNDFGTLGEAASHPELLDWLAQRFVAGGWRIKAMHRLIMTSAAYRQGAPHPAADAALQKDPDNRLVWRARARRLDAEQIRDAMLAASGELSLAPGGPSVEADKPRRSIYTKQIRNRRDPLLEGFDLPAAFTSTAGRRVTTTPSQALLLANGDWVLARAKAMARRLKSECGDQDLGALAAHGIKVAFGREAASDERAAAEAFLAGQAEAIRQRRAAEEPPPRTLARWGGSQAPYFQSGKPEFAALAGSADLPAGDFTIEASFELSSLFENANVRTIAAQWDNDKNKPGWALGVTSKKSRYTPRNLILQFSTGKGEAGYEVVASGLIVELDTPYAVAASVDVEGEEATASFYLLDLSGTSEGLQTAAVKTKVAPGKSALPFMVGGRGGAGDHQWHGFLDDVRLTPRALAQDELLCTAPEEGTLPGGTPTGFWRFEEPEGAKEFAATAGSAPPLAPSGRKPTHATPEQAALEDFCHALLNASEFLYVD